MWIKIFDCDCYLTSSHYITWWNWMRWVICAQCTSKMYEMVQYLSRNIRNRTIHVEVRSQCKCSKSMWMIFILMLIAKAIATTVYMHSVANMVFVFMCAGELPSHFQCFQCIQYLKSFYDWKLHFKSSMWNVFVCQCEQKKMNESEKGERGREEW